MQKMKMVVIGFVLGLFGLFQSCFAAAQDWSGIGTSVDTEVSAAVPIGMGVFGALLAIAIGAKIIKRLSR